jgi:surface protein
MESMFDGCNNLTNINLSSFDTNQSPIPNPHLTRNYNQIKKLN